MTEVFTSYCAGCKLNQEVIEVVPSITRGNNMLRIAGKCKVCNRALSRMVRKATPDDFKECGLSEPLKKIKKAFGKS